MTGIEILEKFFLAEYNVEETVNLLCKIIEEKVIEECISMIKTE